MIHNDIATNRNKNRDVILITIIIICIIAVFSVSLNYPILNDWDDQYYILNNKHLSLSFQNVMFWITNPYYHMYIPVTMFTYMFDFNIWGYNSIGYHLQNILWHIITCVFIYKCFRLFKINQYITFFIVLIFSIHPQRVESVVWLAERKDVVCTAFYFTTVYFYIKNKAKGFSITAFILYLFAFLSKPMAMSIPFILLFFEFYNHKELDFKYYLKKLWIYFLALFIFVPIAFQYQAVTQNKFILSKQIYITFYNIVWYIKTTFIPTNLTSLYAKTNVNNIFSYLLTAYIIIFIFLIIVAVKSKKSFIHVFAPIICCYLASLAPVVGFVPWGSFDRTDRWSYVPSVFILFFVAVLLNKYIHTNKTTTYKSFIKHKIVYTILSIYAALLMLFNILYQQNWQNAYQIYYRASIFHPANKYALWFLSKYELQNKKYLEAFILAKRMAKSNDWADKYRSDYVIASCYFGLKKYQEVINTLKGFVKVEPTLGEKILDSKNKYNNMLTMIAVSYMKLKIDSKALKYFNKIILLNPNSEFLNYYYLGMSFMVMENYDKAIYYFKKSKALAPDKKLLEKRITEAIEKKDKQNNLFSQ
ncbi:MAG: tetratricopeptide repeat protein [bacterium]|nr:tetratricopeptide repeat protein [bacterium]